MNTEVFFAALKSDKPVTDYAYFNALELVFIFCLLHAANIPLRLISCVKIVILGFFSPDDSVKNEHFNFEHGEPTYFEGNDEEIFLYLIKHFSPDGSTVLDMTGLPGICKSQITQLLFLQITSQYACTYTVILHQTHIPYRNCVKSCPLEWEECCLCARGRGFHLSFGTSSFH